MTSIDFYFNAGDRLGVACRLAGKALQQKKRVLIYAPQQEMAQKIDRLLWTSQAVSFIPHCHAHDTLAADTPVLIATCVCSRSSIRRRIRFSPDGRASSSTATAVTP